MAEPFCLKSFLKNLFAPVGVFGVVTTAEGVVPPILGVGSPLELREMEEESGVWGISTLRR